MSNITFIATITAVVMITSMVWFLLTGIRIWDDEMIVAVIFVFGGGNATFYLISVLIDRQLSD